MAKKGQVMTNPANGNCIEWLEISEETNGKHIRFKWTMKQGGLNPVEHLHATQDETFEVLSGKLSYTCEDKSGVVTEGEKLVLPKGIRHRHSNGNAGDTIVIQTVSPALDSEIVIETLYGLSVEGRVPGGQPPLLQVMVWLRSMKSKTYLASIPKAVQDGLSFVLAPIGRLLGYRASYVKYSGFES